MFATRAGGLVERHPMTIFSAFCQTCNGPRRFERPGLNHVLHFLITVLSCGLWAFVWLGLALFGQQPARCIVCGSTPRVSAANVGLRWALFIGLIVGAALVLPDIIARYRTERARMIETRSAPPTVAAAPTFAEQVAASQHRAVAVHPDLGKAGSPTNTRFRVRYEDWKTRGDVRLSRPDWPEKLAEEVAAP